MHPTQVYESINGFLLLCLVMLVRKYRKFSGEMFVAFTMGYAILRYLVEDLRADEQRGSIGPLTTSQLIGVCTFSAGLILFAVALYRAWKRDPQSMRLWENGRAMVAAARGGQGCGCARRHRGRCAARGVIQPPSPAQELTSRRFWHCSGSGRPVGRRAAVLHRSVDVTVLVKLPTQVPVRDLEAPVRARRRQGRSTWCAT